MPKKLSNQEIYQKNKDKYKLYYLNHIDLRREYQRNYARRKRQEHLENLKYLLDHCNDNIIEN